MANYNTFTVVDCKTRQNILVTSSARKANALLRVGTKVEVWNKNQKVETIYERDKRKEQNPLGPYIGAEREYIRKKQEAATRRNRERRFYASKQ